MLSSAENCAALNEVCKVHLPRRYPTLPDDPDDSALRGAIAVCSLTTSLASELT